MKYLVTLKRSRFKSVTRRLVLTQHSPLMLEAWAAHKFPGWEFSFRELASDDPVLNPASGIDWQLQTVVLT